MKQNVTISDIAKAAGVSISSVHLALNNKRGISKATRDRICKVAEEMDYRPNVFARNLKKETQTILVILPDRNAISDHYYGFMWDAARDMVDMASNYNVDILCCGFSQGHLMLSNGAGNVAGIVFAALDGYLHPGMIEALRSANVPLIAVDSEAPYLDCCGCFAADARDVGFLMGELLIDTIHRLDGKILALGAGPSYANRDAVECFLTQQLATVGLDGHLLIVNADEANKECLQAVEDALTGQVVIGACSVNSRSTPILCQAVENTGRKGLFPVIGSGLFEESRVYLLNKTLTAIVDKKPYEQCRQAISAMIGLLAREVTPERKFIPTRLDVIFRSNVAEYDAFRTRKKTGV